MSGSVLMDTSFLISLVNEQRPHHAVAVAYHRHMLTHNMPMFFSSIVAAEFAIKQTITELPLAQFRLLSFNVIHGQKAGTLWNALGHRDPEDARAVVRDDVKLLAQASHEGIGVLLTEDASTLYKYCERLRASGSLQTRAITLSKGFDANALREDGQGDLLGDPAPGADLQD